MTVQPLSVVALELALFWLGGVPFSVLAAYFLGVRAEARALLIVFWPFLLFLALASLPFFVVWYLAWGLRWVMRKVVKE